MGRWGEETKPGPMKDTREERGIGRAVRLDVNVPSMGHGTADAAGGGGAASTHPAGSTGVGGGGDGGGRGGGGLVGQRRRRAFLSTVIVLMCITEEIHRGVSACLSIRA